MMKGPGLLHRISDIGKLDRESANEQQGRQLLVLGGVLMSGGGLLWGGLSLALGLTGPAMVPLGYTVFTAINLRVLARTLNFPRARAGQVLASLILPFFFQWSLGGFVASGGVMLWAMLALVGSLTFSTIRQSIIWLLLFCGLTIFSGLIDSSLVVPLPPSEGVMRLFFVVNITVISATVFGLVITIHARQRSAIAALEEAEGRLTELTSSLEHQVLARTVELERALVRAEAGTRAKDEFLAVMSHEIRTPLNGILGTTELLALSKLEPAQLTWVSLMQRSGGLLLTLINDLLDFSKIEAGKLELTTSDFELVNEVEGVLGLHRPLAQQAGVELRVNWGHDVPARVHADPDRLAQVIGNLLGNAVKFTNEGCVTLSIDAHQLGQHVRLDFAVVDTGIGIEPQQISRLFRPFSQADSTTTRRFGGTGLGLAICARLVERMGGQITVESQARVGTTFRFFVLVDAATSSPSRSPLLEVRGGSEGLGLRVLLAEDNPMNQTIGVRLLEHLACEVVLARDGEEAIAMVNEQTFDLVFMDLQMPVLDGLHATRAIRGLTCAQPRIVALTANAFESDRTACLAAGMDDFMTKPLKVEMLRRQLLATQALRSRRPATG